MVRVIINPVFYWITIAIDFSSGNLLIAKINYKDKKLIYS
jgi:hypothetical protein